MSREREQLATPKIGEGKRGISGHLLYLLRQANAAVQQAVDRELADLGLSLSQYSALTMIAAYPGLSNAELSRLSMLTPQSANETVRRLELMGLIERAQDPSHGRILRMDVTAHGRQLLRRARARSDKVESFLQARTGNDETAVRRWLVEIARELAAGEDLHDPRPCN